MKRIKLLFTALCLTVLWGSQFTPDATAVTNADYTAAPPFIASAIPPNILIVLDNSGSMNSGAYTSEYDPSQFTSGHYYGLFDPTVKYQYTNNGRWEVTSLALTNGTVNNPIATGNFLNWATMRRVDVAKKLLIGGKASPRSPSAGITVKLYGEPSSGWDFHKDYDNSAETEMYPFPANYRFTMSGANLSVVPVSSNPDNILPSSQVFKAQVENGAGQWTATGLWHIETGTCLQNHTTGGTASWYYGRYVSTDTPTCNFNKTVTSGAIPLTFTASGSKITRASGSFITDGFTVGTIRTTSTNNPGPFTIITVSDTTINVSEAVVDESVTATVNSTTPLTNSGDLTSGSIVLSAGSAPQLSFWYYYQTEGFTSYDTKYVQISTDGGATFTNLLQLSSTTGQSGGTTAPTLPLWQQQAIDLSAYAGQTIKLRFSFNTIDAIANNFTGWYIDDILITGNAASCGISTPAAWTLGGTGAPATACAAVNEVTSDGNTTYIQNTTTTDPVIFNYNYYNNPDFKSAVISSVAVKVVAERVGSGSSPTRKLKGVLQVNGTNYASAASSSLTSSYSTYTFTWATNPATAGLAWTWNDIKSGGVGSIKGFGLQPNELPTAAVYPRVTQVYMVVTVALASGGPYNIIVDQGMTKAHGLVDDLGDEARFGLSFYNGSSEGGHIDTYVDFGSPVSMITSIGNMSPSTWTPLAETIYEDIRYFRQEAPNYSNSPADYRTGSSYDPYYFQYSKVTGSTLPDQYVPCAKSYILLLTDGESTQDQNIPASIKGLSTGYRFAGTPVGQTYASSGTDYLIDVARYGRVNDARPATSTPPAGGLAGTQDVVLYTVFMFGKGSTLLQDASINGGFDDRDGNNNPTQTNMAEWRRDSNGDGVITSDDLPITYYEGDDGEALQTSITMAIADMLKRTSSGTSVSILATSAEGEGALYQAYFYPEKIMLDGSKRQWLGYCRGLFLDAFGNLRDDCSSVDPTSCSASPDARLVYKKDNIVRLSLDPTTSDVKANLYRDANEDGSIDSTTTPPTPNITIGVDEMTALWEGGTRLALRDKTTRSIYTFLDSNHNGSVDSGEFIDLSVANVTALQPYLRAADATEATNIINYTRGLPVTGYRNRCMPITGSTAEAGCNTGERSWALGDIVYSTPTVVSGAREQYDQIYGGKAANYAAFRSKYNNRRHVVYVGSNDGMLHAFNAGVYTAGDDTSTTDKEHGWFVPNPTSGSGWSGLGLGDELWAFVPYDNLPHLKWMTQSDYSHVYYVDLKPKPTDVNIFCDSDTTLNPPTAPNCVNGQSTSHPGGWGTILIVGMKFGGGAIDADLSVPANGNTTDPGEKSFRSSYYALDVTDPEKPPKLLWRFTDPNLGFTTSYPGIMHVGGTSEKWYMVVGSGPGPNNTQPPAPNTYKGISTQQGRIFIVNLLNGTSSLTFSNLGKNNAGAALDSNAFMGDSTVVDGDLDFTSDVIYIGSAIGSTISTMSGKVFRITTANNPDPATWELSVLINQGKPLLVGPSVSKDSLNHFWVFFGTGRLMSVDDKTDTNQQTLFGIKDACWKRATGGTCTTTYVKTTDLANATNTVVCASGKTYNSAVAGQDCTTTTSTYTSLLSSARTTYQGWYKDISYTGTTPSERVLARSVILGGVVLFTTFTPNSDICSFQGDSSLYALYYETGTAYTKSVVGTSGSGASEIILNKISLGKGLPTTVGIAVGKKTKGFIQTSTGTIVEVEAQPALGIRSGAASWRETSEGGGTSEVETIYKHISK